MSEKYLPPINTESSREIVDSLAEQTKERLNSLSEDLFQKQKFTVKTKDVAGKGNLRVRVEKNGAYIYKYTLTPGETVTATGRYRIGQDSPTAEKDHLWLEVTFREGGKVRKGWVSSKYLVGELPSIREKKKEVPKEEKKEVPKEEKKEVPKEEKKEVPKEEKKEVPKEEKKEVPKEEKKEVPKEEKKEVPKEEKKEVPKEEKKEVPKEEKKEVPKEEKKEVPKEEKKEVPKEEKKEVPKEEKKEVPKEEKKEVPKEEKKEVPKEEKKEVPKEEKKEVPKEEKKEVPKEEKKEVPKEEKKDTILTIGPLGLPLLPADGLVRRGGNLYKLSLGSYYSYTADTKLGGSEFEKDKQEKNLFDNGEGRAYVLSEKCQVYTPDDIVKKAGNIVEVKDGVYLGSDGLKRRIFGYTQYNINQINKQEIWKLLDNKNTKLIRINGQLSVITDVQEEKEVPLSSIDHFDTTDIKNWPRKEGKILFYPGKSIRDYYWPVSDIQLFEKGIQTSGKLIAPKDLLIVKMKNEKGILEDRFIVKPSQISILGDENTFRDVPNGTEIAHGFMDDNIDARDYSDVMKRMRQVAENIVKTSTNKGEIIDKIYTYVKENTTYSPPVGKYYEDLDKFYKGELPAKPTEVPPNPEDGSGPDTFNNHSGVCEGYAENLLILLSFAGIKNVENVYGLAPSKNMLKSKAATGWTDDQKNEMRHAWIKIDGKHYDPTWDDNEKNPGAPNQWFGITDDEMKKRGREWEK